MPSRPDDTPPRRRGFLSRALSSGKLSGKSSDSKDTRRKSIYGPDAGISSADIRHSDIPLDARPTSIVATLPLPPSLTNRDPIPPLPSPNRPSAPTRSTSSYSVSTSSVTSSSAPPNSTGYTRRFSLYDPNNPIFPSAPRSREASSGSASSRPKSMHSSTSSASLSAATPTGSGARPQSVHASSTSSRRSNRQTFTSSSPPPPLPSHPSQHSLLTSNSGGSFSLLGSNGDSSSENEEKSSIGRIYAPQGTGTGTMDQMVDGMRRSGRSRNGSGSAKGKGRAEGEDQPRRRKEGFAAPPPARSEMKNGSRANGTGPRSRETSAASTSSAFSDASFASMHAVAPPPGLSPPPPPLPSSSQCTPRPKPIDEDLLDFPPPDGEDEDHTGAPGMERQETLKAFERPWMRELRLPSGGTRPKSMSMDELVAMHAAGQKNENGNANANGSGRNTPEKKEVSRNERGRYARSPSWYGLNGDGRRGGEGEGHERDGAREGGGEPPPLPPEKDYPPFVSSAPSRRSSAQLSTPSAPTRRPSYGASLSPPLPNAPFASSAPPPPTSSSSSASIPVPSLPPASSSTAPPLRTERIKSIAEIIAEHAGPAVPDYIARRRSSVVPPSAALASAAVTGVAPPVPALPVGAGMVRGWEESASSATGTETSFDSLEEELRSVAKAEERAQAAVAEDEANAAELAKRGSRPQQLFHWQSINNSSSRPLSPSVSTTLSRTSSIQSTSTSLRSATPSTSVSTPRQTASPKPPPLSSSPSVSSSAESTAAAEQALSTLLSSPRLTRLFTLPSNRNLTVSLADVGSPTGHPVLIFLGLGSVRYLVALYDEIATVLGLRLICIDRWGLGRTTSVEDEKRGFAEWAEVVKEVVGPKGLGLSEVSILAHSAGAPYAIACATHTSLSSLYSSAPDGTSADLKIHGSLHLLAPWVSSEVSSLAGIYKYLKFVPSGVIKTAQAAEWKLQGWRLGKLPVGSSPGGEGGAAAAAQERREDDGEEAQSKKRESGREKWIPPTSPNLAEGNGAAKVAELYGSESSVVVAGPGAGVGGTPSRSSGGSKGWKLLGGLGRSSTPPLSNEDGSSSTRSSPLRSSSMLSKRSSFHGMSFAGSPSTLATDSTSSLSTAASSRVLSPSGLPLPLKRSSLFSTTSSSSSATTHSLTSSPTTPTRSDSRASFASTLNPQQQSYLSPSLVRSSSTSSIPLSAPPLPPQQRTPSPAPPAIAPAALISGLLRASHAESLSGSTSDLLVLLDRTSPSSPSTSTSTADGRGVDYVSLANPLKVWYGDRDDRISLASVRWLEREVKERGKDGTCEVRVVEGADHSLMANGRVMLEALESIAAEWVKPRSARPVQVSTSLSSSFPSPS